MTETCLSRNTCTVTRIHTSSTCIKLNPPGTEKNSQSLAVPEAARQLKLPENAE
jgi:hypothetical protein